MRLELIKRQQRSKLFMLASPFIALLLTLLGGAVLFAGLGKDPISGLYYYFINPLEEIWSLHELAVKAGPLILIASGLCLCYRSNNWNVFLCC